jgi:type II secretory pathway pseudopilin PulG
MCSRYTRRGVTLIEAVLFIAVALALIVGGLVFFQQAQTARRANETIRLLSALSTEARALFGRAKGLGGGGTMEDLESLLIAAGAVPSNAIDSTGAGIVTPWGGDLNSGVTDDGTTCSEGELVYSFVIFDVPREICTRIVRYGPGGSGVFTDDLANVATMSPKSSGTALETVYTDRWPRSCLAPEGPIDPATVRTEFGPADAARMCSSIDPADNKIIFIMFFN